MGYTHYKNKQRAFTDAEWKLFVKKAKSILTANASIIAGPGGDLGTRPIINDTVVSFNGREDDSHETCVVTKRENDFDFCKTACKPYDAVVVEVWKAARDILGNDDVKLSSDGGDEVFKVTRAKPAKVKSTREEMLIQLKLCLRLIEDENLDELHGDLAECVRDVIERA